MLLKVWSMGWQHQHHLRAYRISELSTDPLNLNLPFNSISSRHMKGNQLLGMFLHSNNRDDSLFNPWRFGSLQCKLRHKFISCFLCLDIFLGATCFWEGVMDFAELRMGIRCIEEKAWALQSDVDSDLTFRTCLLYKIGPLKMMRLPTKYVCEVWKGRWCRASRKVPSIIESIPLQKWKQN